MIDGQKIVAFTVAGRKRFMDLLVPHVMRDQAAGIIDEWLLFNNAFKWEDSTYTEQIAAHLPWATAVKEVHAPGPGQSPLTKFQWHPPNHICDVYQSPHMKYGDGTIYVRLDDDVCYVDKDAITRLVKYRLEHPEPFLVYPTIVNNVHTSYHMQQAGVIPKEWGDVTSHFVDTVAHRNSDFVWNMHQKALGAIARGTLVEEFKLPSGSFTDYDDGRLSINSFAMFGRDMAEMNVPPDEEGYIARVRPEELGRQNARCGDAVVIHFAFGWQTAYMDSSGMAIDYARLAPVQPGFRTHQLCPAFGTEGVIDVALIPTAAPAAAVDAAAINRAAAPPPPPRHPTVITRPPRIFHARRPALKA